MRHWPLALAALISTSVTLAGAPSERLPNIVLILTDNHGAWTLGCYGNEDVRTPHIDRLASEGALFTRAFSVNPVCSPTRASILTGLMPSQHGVMVPVGNHLMMGPQARNTLEEFTSLPEILKKNGYACGLSGKWHLGANMTPQEGLDDLWVTMPIGSTPTFYGAQIIENGSVRTEPQYMTDLWTDRAVKFIRDRARSESPFFLYLAYNGPYGLSPHLLEPARNRHAEYYANHPLPSFPRVPTRPWQFSNRDYVNNLKAFRRYAAEVSGVDDGVGRVLQALREAGVEDNTIVIFTGDQGSGAGQHNLWGMGDHTRPLHAFDTTMHVPLMLRYPGVISHRTKINRLVSQVDLLPTVLEFVGLGDQLPTEHPLPGQNLVPLIESKNEGLRSSDENAVFFEFDNTRAIRTADWKLVERIDEDGALEPFLAHDELYDLVNDPGETRNLYSDPAHQRIRDQLLARLKDFFAKHNIPKYDSWNDGKPQTRYYLMGEEARARYAERLRRGFPQMPFDPDFNPPPMTIPDGIAVETAAAPPLVNHPVAGCLDDRGCLFLCENTGNNFIAEKDAERSPDVIALLTDTNGDGNYDQRQVFAEGFTFAQGIVWHDGALFVASASAIWKLTDKDADGKADTRVAIASGNDATRFFAPRISPDGRLYWTHGRKPPKVLNRDFVDEGNSAQIWMSLPDGRDVRSYCGGGIGNPAELDFWPTGEVIGNVNITRRASDRRGGLLHWQYGGTYPSNADLTDIANSSTTAPMLREFFAFGRAVVGGMTLYRSGALSPGGEDWTNDIFMTSVNHQELVRLDIERNGSTFRAVQHPYLKIHNEDVHLASVLEDADGSLLLIDAGAKFQPTRGSCDTARPDVPGAIYRIRQAGPWNPLTDYRGDHIDWENADTTFLAALLGGSFHLIRQRATTALAARGADAVSPLANVVATHPDPSVRIRAVFALCRIGAGPARNPIRAALRDRDPAVRLAATRAVGELKDKAALRFLLPNLNHAFLALQRETAAALGRIGDPEAISPLLTALTQRKLDRPREHAIIWALIEIGNARALRDALVQLEPLYADNHDFNRRVTSLRSLILPISNQ